MANEMSMKAGAGIVTLLAVFAFFVVAICTLGGEQSGLNTRKFGDVHVKDNLTVDTSLKLNNAADNAGFLTGLTRNAVGAGANATMLANNIYETAHTGGATATLTLPSANVGTRVIVTLGGVIAAGANALTFVCAANDSWETGSIVPTTAGALILYDISAAGEATLTYTPVGASTNFLDQGSMFYFMCVDGGRWQLNVINKPGATGSTTGTLLFSA